MREAIIDLQAITANVRHLKRIAGVDEFIAVVKADGYGHGALDTARAAIAGGATRVGVADVREAITLRDAGLDDIPMLAWLHQPEETFEEALRRDIELGVSSLEQLERAANAAERGASARVHFKLETGLARGGAAPADWPVLFARARRLEQHGRIRVVGLFSHLSGASRDDDLKQVASFREGYALALNAGLRPSVQHLAATGATISLPEARFNTVRVGIGIYGLSPFANRTSPELGLRPAMRLQAPVAAVRRVPAGQGVSYDYVYRAAGETSLALVPLGYADGIPRQATGSAAVLLNGRRYPVVGRIAMDQFVVDVGDDNVRVGDIVTVFGDPNEGVPSADEWAAAANTINYDIVTRIGARVRRVQVDSPVPAAAATRLG